MIRYTPGEWFALVTDGRVALLAPTTELSVVEEVWASLRAGDDVAAQLQPMLRAGIAAMPPFALVKMRGDTVHAVVRGDARVVVGTAEGEWQLTGGRATTWVEETLDGVLSVTVSAPDAAPETRGSLQVVAAVVKAVVVEARPDDAVVEPVAAPGAEAVALPAVPVAVPVVEDVAAPAAEAEAPADVAPEPEPEPEVEVPADAEPDAEPEPAPDAEPEAPEDVQPEAGTEDPEDEAQVQVEVLPELEPEPEPEPEAVADPAPEPEADAEPAPEGEIEIEIDAGSSVADLLAAPLFPSESVPPPAGGDAFAEQADAADDDEGLEFTVVSPTPTLDAAIDDHDGLTILTEDIAALRGEPWAGVPVADPDQPPANPARIRISTGQVVGLDRPVLLGRAPQVSRVTNDRLPTLVTVPSPNNDISRTHLQVRQEGEDVVVTDLHSTNGVLLVRDGLPQRMHPGEAVAVLPGVIIDVGDGITFTVERG